MQEYLGKQWSVGEPRRHLEGFCKRNSAENEIDFLQLEAKMGHLQTIQERTYEQIVEFVDRNRDSFLAINTSLSHIQDKVKKSEFILKQLAGKIAQYRAGYYEQETAVQTLVCRYELGQVQDRLVAVLTREINFLKEFNRQFEQISGRSIEQLSYNHRAVITRVTYKLPQLRVLLDHEIVVRIVPDNLKIGEIVTALGDQLECYIGEQLAKLVRNCFRSNTDQKNHIEGRNMLKDSIETKEYVETKDLDKMNVKDHQTTEETRKQRVLDQFRLWYANLNKPEQYYRIIEQDLIGKQFGLLERNLLVNKADMLANDGQLIAEFFTRLFAATSRFPPSYPKERLFALIQSFLRKEELKFLYTYVMPIFPVSYLAYIRALEQARLPQTLEDYLKRKHNWNLKMWLVMREKNILQRSSQKDKNQDLLYWLGIIFKSSFMIPGTTAGFVKLAFKVINRWVATCKNRQFSVELVNSLVDYRVKVGQLLRTKVAEIMCLDKEGVGQSLKNQERDDPRSIVERIAENAEEEIGKAGEELIVRSMQMIVATCQGAFEPFKSFVMKTLKRDSSQTANEATSINKSETVFRPLRSYFKNTIELSHEAAVTIQKVVQGALVSFYDYKYAQDIYKYARENMVQQQVVLVVDAVAKERNWLFHGL